jgi:HTH-type transcriptional regulator/antitoxin HigA
MNIAPIKSKRDYERTLSRIERLMDAKLGTKAGDELDVLTWYATSPAVQGGEGERGRRSRPLVSAARAEKSACRPSSPSFDPVHRARQQGGRSRRVRNTSYARRRNRTRAVVPARWTGQADGPSFDRVERHEQVRRRGDDRARRSAVTGSGRSTR